MVSYAGATKTQDLLYDTFYSAAVGGSVTALFFLILDVVAGQALFTPSMIGTVIFTGADPATVTEVRMDMIAYLTLIHFAGFGTLGLGVATLVRNMESLAAHPGIITLFVFLALAAGFFIPAALLFPGLAAEVGIIQILSANALTAVAMAIFLRQAHPDAHD